MAKLRRGTGRTSVCVSEINEHLLLKIGWMSARGSSALAPNCLDFASILMHVISPTVQQNEYSHCEERDSDPILGM